MSSVVRMRMEPTSLIKHSLLQTYAIRNEATDSYSYVFFTVSGQTLYRIENDLSGILWVVARNMGKERVISSIDSALLNFFASESQWQNIRVVRPGIARKYQFLNVPYGDSEIGYVDTMTATPEPQYNDGSYMCSLVLPPYATGASDAPNSEFIVGYAETTVSSTVLQNLPYGTFWAIVDPIVIEYTYNSVRYQRAIRHKVSPIYA